MVILSVVLSPSPISGWYVFLPPHCEDCVCCRTREYGVRFNRTDWVSQSDMPLVVGFDPTMAWPKVVVVPPVSC